MFVACVALVFSMTGTGIAASHYIITSKNQIKPSVVRFLRESSGLEYLHQSEEFAAAKTANEETKAQITKLCDAIETTERYATLDDALTRLALNKIFTTGC